MCILLALLLCVGCFGVTAFAASEDPETVPGAAAEETASETPSGAAHDAVFESSQEEDTDSDDAAQPSATAAHGRIGEGLPEGAAAYSPDVPESEDQSREEIFCTVVGDGSVYVLVDDEAVELDEWIETADFPATDVQFAAVPDDVKDEVTAVTLDGKDIEFKEEDAMWVFTIDTLEAGSTLVVSFGDTIPGSINVLGPGRVSILDEDEWEPVSEEESAFEGTIGTLVRILATSTQQGYAATVVTIGDRTIDPIMYSAEGPVYEFAIEAPLMDVTVRFLETDEIDMEIVGEGTVEMSVSDVWVQLENGAKIPFDPEDVTADDPMVFRAVPADGYSMSDARYASYPLILTKMDSPEDQPDLEQYMFSIADPRDDALLRVTFLASSDSAVEWLRGSDTTTGISWAVPLGTSVYGVSNVTQGSTVRTTLLTQGTAYEQARTLAARFGSVFTAWDFTIVNAQGAAYQPTVPILFSIPIPSGYPATTQSLRMLHILADGQMQENPIEIRTDSATGRQYIYMRAESLSTFILVNTASGSSVPTAVPTYAPTAVPTAPIAGAAAATATPSTAPGTGDESAQWIFVLLAVAACAAVACAGMGLAARNTDGR